MGPVLGQDAAAEVVNLNLPENPVGDARLRESRLHTELEAADAAEHGADAQPVLVAERERRKGTGRGAGHDRATSIHVPPWSFLFFGRASLVSKVMTVPSRTTPTAS